MNRLEEEYKEILESGKIDSALYEKYNVKRGLRNSNGTGVLVGLTKVAQVYGYKIVNGKKVDDDGHLYYRDIDIYDLAKMDKNHFGYEMVCFLLLFGHLPTSDELNWFKNYLSSQYDLPKDFLENIILKNPSQSLMNHISRCILSLYSYDENPDSTDGFDLLKKGIWICAKMPAIISYSLQAKTHYLDNDSLHINFPRKDYSIAENILYLSRNDGIFTDLEADTLDLCLMIHADHGGGNNSAFVNVVVSSTGTDIYSAISASLGALKGPRHGGANMKVLDMMNAIIDEISINASDDDIRNICQRILNKNFFDNSGLIYGIGHAVYTKSDPRCKLLKEKCRELSKVCDNALFNFYERFESIAVNLLEERKGMCCCANVDFYSGLTYKFLRIPRDLFIPIFAAARVVGWVAHNIENTIYCNKIIRPACKYVGKEECSEIK